ncbi:hypothetical protein B0J18DRAFT_19584 [Chaetomium sp. MPI-SDFR-AT-0129]|nr:hypothetical protein B0J18DRAFT_19584 [Chaetomium sp. MPI-SDFR-AT-0129]
MNRTNRMPPCWHWDLWELLLCRRVWVGCGKRFWSLVRAAEHITVQGCLWIGSWRPWPGRTSMEGPRNSLAPADHCRETATSPAPSPMGPSVSVGLPLDLTVLGHSGHLFPSCPCRLFGTLHPASSLLFSLGICFFLEGFFGDYMQKGRRVGWKEKEKIVEMPAKTDARCELPDKPHRNTTITKRRTPLQTSKQARPGKTFRGILCEGTRQGNLEEGGKSHGQSIPSQISCQTGE